MISMLRYITAQSSAVLILASALFASCGNSGEPDKKEEMRDTTVTTEPVPAQADSQEVSYTLPSTLQIANIFRKAGLSYYSGITNPTGNLKAYKGGSPFAKALNLGVYSADLSYCILNRQSEESRDYFKACKELASDLGLSKPFEAVAKRLEKNLDKQDSLAMILVAIQMETDEILSSSGQEHVSVISFAGAWIESVYIGTRVHAKEGHTRIADKLVEQMGIADNIIKALRAHRLKDQHIDGLLKQMQSINDLYNNFEAIKEIKAADPDVIDPAKVHIGVKELYSFSQKIEEIRSAITKG
jgi:hypothetical protein